MVALSEILKLESKAPSTRIRFIGKQRIFSPAWRTVYTYPVKTVTEDAFFQKRAPGFFKMSAYCFHVDLACERTLRGALAARRGREKEGELAIMSLELI